MRRRDAGHHEAQDARRFIESVGDRPSRSGTGHISRTSLDASSLRGHPARRATAAVNSSCGAASCGCPGRRERPCRRAFPGRAAARSACRRCGCRPASPRRPAGQVGGQLDEREVGPDRDRPKSLRHRPPSLASAPTIWRGSTLWRLPTAIRYVAIGSSARRDSARPRRRSASPAVVGASSRGRRAGALGLGLEQQRRVALQHRRRARRPRRPRARRARGRSATTTSRKKSTRSSAEPAPR